MECHNDKWNKPIEYRVVINPFSCGEYTAFAGMGARVFDECLSLKEHLGIVVWGS